LNVSERSRYGVVTALYNVIWSYIGYSNANYALSEVKDPVKTLKRSALAAIILVSILYMLVNVSMASTTTHLVHLTYSSRSHTSPQSPKPKSSPRAVSSPPPSFAMCSAPRPNAPCPFSSLYPPLGMFSP
jgi:amino acid transporter